jgi:hypothetical protein
MDSPHYFLIPDPPLIPTPHAFTEPPLLSILLLTCYSYRNSNSSFREVLEKLESDPICQRLSLKSFLILPFQRITRLKLLLQVWQILLWFNCLDSDMVLERLEAKCHPFVKFPHHVEDGNRFPTVHIFLSQNSLLLELCP